MSENRNQENEQFVVSYELLNILHWLLKFESKGLSDLLAKSFAKGVDEKIENHDMYSQIQLTEDAQHSVVEFFNFLESAIIEITNKESTKHIMNKHVMNTLDHIDPKRCDFETIKSTVLATAEKIKPNQQPKAKEQFLKELLRQWKPKKEKNKKLTLN